jgi:hypothetical protein
MSIPEPKGICQNCNVHAATNLWVGEGSSLDLIHGHYQNWCACCVLKAQIEHAELMVSRLDRLKAELAKVHCSQEPPPS